mgnify:CR=1 FL=1
MTAFLQALASGLALGAIYGLIALGFNITYATTKTFNFGQGAFLVPGSLVGVSLLLLAAGKPHFGNLTQAEMTMTAYVLATIASVVVVGAIGVSGGLGGEDDITAKAGLTGLPK